MQMKKNRKNSVIHNSATDRTISSRQSRRKFLQKTGGILAASAFGAVPLRGWAAEPVNIGAHREVTIRELVTLQKRSLGLAA